jgi:hypothetical protein
MPEGLDDLGVVDEEDARKLKGISYHFAYSICEHHAVAELALPHLPSKELTESSPPQREFAIERLTGVADTLLILQPESREEFLRLLFSAHVYERQLRSRGCDFGSLGADLRNRLRAVWSTKMTQEDEQQRTLCAERSKRDSVLRLGAAECFCY